MDSLFRVDLIAATPNPQQCIYAAMHQDYSEGFVAADRDSWPDEQRAGEICIKRLLAGGRSNWRELARRRFRTYDLRADSRRRASPRRGSG